MITGRITYSYTLLSSSLKTVNITRSSYYIFWCIYQASIFKHYLCHTYNRTLFWLQEFPYFIEGNICRIFNRITIYTSRYGTKGLWMCQHRRLYYARYNKDCKTDYCFQWVIDCDRKRSFITGCQLYCFLPCRTGGINRANGVDNIFPLLSKILSRGWKTITPRLKTKKLQVTYAGR